MMEILKGNKIINFIENIIAYHPELIPFPEPIHIPIDNTIDDDYYFENLDFSRSFDPNIEFVTIDNECYLGYRK